MNVLFCLALSVNVFSSFCLDIAFLYVSRLTPSPFCPSISLSLHHRLFLTSSHFPFLLFPRYPSSFLYPSRCSSFPSFLNSLLPFPYFGPSFLLFCPCLPFKSRPHISKQASKHDSRANEWRHLWRSSLCRGL